MRPAYVDHRIPYPVSGAQAVVPWAATTASGFLQRTPTESDGALATGVSRSPAAILDHERVLGLHDAYVAGIMPAVWTG